MDLEIDSADLGKLISDEVLASGRQSASEAGVLRLPTAGSGQVLTSMEDNAEATDPSAEPTGAVVRPTRRLGAAPGRASCLSTT